jgi:hypothetical protein
MALNMNDPYIRAERQPASLVALGVRLKAHYGVGADNFGIKGNEYHTSGFHRSRNWILNSVQGSGSGDYSVRGSRNMGGGADNDAAFDITPGVWGTAENRRLMVELTKRVYDAAVRRDPRVTANWYEFAGTLDGKTVVTFYADGGGFKSPFDSSHLEHLHGSGYRDTIEKDHTGLGDVLLGVGGEDEDDMGASFGPQDIKLYDADLDFHLNVTSLTIPPVQGGAADPRPCWLNFCNDTGEPYGLRIWYTTGNEGYSPFPQTANGQLVLRSGQRWSVEIPKGTGGLSIARQAVNSDGKAVAPTAELRAYSGHLTLAIERGAVIK